jgi:hypothetical protein
MADVAFPPIAPAPTRDYRTFDFTAEMLAIPPGMPVVNPLTPRPGGQIVVVPDPSPSPQLVEISEAVWSIEMEPSSEVPDEFVYTRLMGHPVNDANHSSHLLGDMVDSAIYVLRCQITDTVGRIFVKQGELICLTQQEPVHPPIDAGVVVFDYNRFVSAFPAFAGTNSDTLERMWISAGLIFRNNWTSPEQDLPTRAYLLALLTAHIATLFAGPPGSPSGMYGGGGMVGRINSKSVDGVSVSADGFPGVSGTQTWYLSTQYGALFWKATAAYRTMHYVPGPIRFPQYGGFPLLPYSRRYFW